MRTAACKDMLIAYALEAQKRAYCPHSNFRVGAALFTANGVFRGCNVESAAFNPSVHAEQTAVVSAIAAGVNPDDLYAIAVVGPASDIITPCGVCRQFLAEFSPPDDPIVIYCLSAGGENVYETTLTELLPHQFPSPKDIALIGR